MERKHIKVTAEDIRAGKLTAAEALAPVFGLVDLTAGYMNYLADVTLLTTEQLLSFAVLNYLNEVREGGHEKFLYDAAGMLWREAIVGLDAVGAPEAAENLRSLRNRFAPELSFEQAERIRQIEENNLYFDEEDKVFRACEADIESLLDSYIRQNAEAFGFDGDI